MSDTLFLCAGKSCRKKNQQVDDLLKVLDPKLKIKEVRCQNICSGPVIGLKLAGRWEWFKKVRKPRDVLAVFKTQKRGKMTEHLKKLRVKKRSGKLRS